MGIQWEAITRPDGSLVDFKITADNGAWISQPMTGQEIGPLIHGLGQERAKLADSGIPETPPQGQAWASFDPKFRVIREPLREGIAIALRDVGIGWRFYALTDEAARTLMGQIQEALVQPKQSENGRPN